MKWLKRLFWVLLVILAILIATASVIINPFGPSPLNKYKKTGSLVLPGLQAPVKVMRDEKGMAYIYAENFDDLMMAQGFVTAQDRLFHMELIRLAVSGRISELAGAGRKQADIRTRTLGSYRKAKEHEKTISDTSRRPYQKYVDGINAFISTRPEDLHLEFKLAGIKPAPWTVTDSLAVLYYMGWYSAGNLKAEIIAQMLVDKLGPVKAAELFPVNINPEDSFSDSTKTRKAANSVAELRPEINKALLPFSESSPYSLGSNSWAVGPRFSSKGSAILANDPHLQASLLPGPLYPLGLFTPEIRAVVATVPGLPGMFVGRTRHLAIGLTNGFADVQDLYIETIDPDDPDRYMEGKRSIPFEVIEETLKIKDKNAPGGFQTEKIKIRSTRRGPVISPAFPELNNGRVVTLRWAAMEKMASVTPFVDFLTCRNINEFRSVLKDFSFASFNYVFADTQGNIGRQSTGRLPVRSQGEALLPSVVTNGQDNWTGWIPWKDMPGEINPKKGWVGTTNNLPVGRDYPYYYTSHIATSYRYRRLMELLDKPEKKSAYDHLLIQRDTVNVMAREIAPIMARALVAHQDTKTIGEILASWDYDDRADQAAPSIFHSVYRQFALLVYSDDLGDSLARTMLGDWYFWQERLHSMILKNDSPWFDNIKTRDKKETRDELFHVAALNAAIELKSILGDDPVKWDWGRLHRYEFVSPLKRSGPGKGLLGGGSYPAPGSVDTLGRGRYDFNKPYTVTVFDSMRMVVDMGDPDKVLAVIPGGVVGRQFHPHMKDQIKPYLNGDKIYWWFSDKAIKENARDKLTLNPR